jgi:hypothetical protein
MTVRKNAGTLTPHGDPREDAYFLKRSKKLRKLMADRKEFKRTWFGTPNLINLRRGPRLPAVHSRYTQILPDHQHHFALCHGLCRVSACAKTSNVTLVEEWRDSSCTTFISSPLSLRMTWRIFLPGPSPHDYLVMSLISGKSSSQYSLGRRPLPGCNSMPRNCTRRVLPEMVLGSSENSIRRMRL